jgi:hypothetical protein
MCRGRLGSGESRWWTARSSLRPRHALESWRVTKDCVARQAAQVKSRSLLSASRVPSCGGMPLGRRQRKAGVRASCAVNQRLGGALGTNRYTPRYTAPKRQLGRGLRGDRVFSRHKVPSCAVGSETSVFAGARGHQRRCSARVRSSAAGSARGRSASSVLPIAKCPRGRQYLLSTG